MIKTSLLAVVLSVLSLNLSGCGGSGDRPEVGLVTGTVTVDGKPQDGLVVVFHPAEGRPARGTTDSDGKYELRYVGDAMGAKIGINRVEIAVNEEDDEEESGTGGEPEANGPATPKPRKVNIPARYNSKTELKAAVEPGENTFDFNLESKP